MVTANWLSALKGALGRKRGGRNLRRVSSRRETRPAGTGAERLEVRSLLSSYSFVKIVETGAAYSQLGDQPAIGGNGEVAFRAIEVGAGTFNVVAKGSGGAITAIETDAGPYYQFGEPSINTAGQVAFLGFSDNPIEQGILIGNGVGAATTVVSATSAAGPGEFEQLDRRPDINDDGDIAFMGDTPETTGVYHRAVGGTITALAQESDGYSPFSLGETFVSISHSTAVEVPANVSFNANLANGEKVIVRHSGPGGTRINLRDTSGNLSTFSRTSVSNDGDVATGVTYDTGSGPGVLTLSDGGATEVLNPQADDSEFLLFDAPNLIDNFGSVVFFAQLDAGGYGIFARDASGVSKVVKLGDPLDGSTVSSLAFSANGANRIGQVTFYATLEDGRAAIFRADPDSELLDWGDLPETGSAILPAGYRTTSASGGPSHVITPGLELYGFGGSEIDAESDGQPSANADGDDSSADDDEQALGVSVSDQTVNPYAPDSGVSFTLTVSTSVRNLTGASARLFTFVEVNRDGDFDDAGESQSTAVSGSGGVANNFLITGVPVADGAYSFVVRHRLSTASSLGPNGPAPDGEVEDNIVTVNIDVPEYDWGDLPEESPLFPGVSYHTTAAANGPSHVIRTDLMIGNTVDAESNGQPTASANGDDAANIDDESPLDVVISNQAIGAGNPATALSFDLKVSTTATNFTGQLATLFTFVDWNHDGDFDDAGESQSQSVPDGSNDTHFENTFAVTGLPAVSGDVAFAVRHRLALTSLLGPDGPASDGEVEDNIATASITLLDWGDLPQFGTDILPAGYRTKANVGGPSHVIVPGLSINEPGLKVDAEMDGQPSDNADGDDLAGDDDEVALTVAITVVDVNPNAPETGVLLNLHLTSHVTNQNGNAATLSTFVDLNHDGDFEDDGERRDSLIVDGSVGLSVTETFEVRGLPVSAATYHFAVRQRLSLEENLGPDGPSSSGEVEDHVLTISVELPRPTETELELVTEISGELTTNTLISAVYGPISAEHTPSGQVKYELVREISMTAAGVDSGYSSKVTVTDGEGNELTSFAPYATSFLGGVRVALGDLDGDGVTELLTAQGPGRGTEVSIYSMSSGGDGSEFGFIASEHITISDPAVIGPSGASRGLRVAAGDVNGDGLADVIVAGGSKVWVFHGGSLQPLRELTPFGTSVTDLQIAVGDINGDGLADIITATGAGFAPRLKAFDGSQGDELLSILPFESTFRGGVNVAVGDLDGDGRADILAAKGPGSTPLVKVFDGDETLLDSSLVYGTTFRGGVNVAVADMNGDGLQDVVISPAVAGVGEIKTIPGMDPKDPLFRPLGGQPLFKRLLDPATSADFVNVAAIRTARRITLGTAELNENGVATLVTDDLPAGTHTIEAAYVGSQTFAPSRSVPITVVVNSLLDFGDAPDSYQTTLANDGARHRPVGPTLGTHRDAELDARLSALNTLGDDFLPNGAPDDEDGVTFMASTLFRRDDVDLTSTVTVNASAAGFLDAFIDFNRNGQFERHEKLTGASIPVIAGNNMISFVVPGGEFAPLNSRGVPDLSRLSRLSQAGSTAARFRLSTAGGLGPAGSAADGEVEDHIIRIAELSADANNITETDIQLPSQSSGGASFSFFEVFVSDNVLTLAGMSSGGDRTPLFQMPANTRAPINIMGTPGDDLLRLDLSGSNVSMQDFHFDGGGEATAAGDGIEIIGGSRVFQRVGVDYSDLEDGVITLDQSRIEFVDLEPINLPLVSEEAFISFGGPLYSTSSVSAFLIDENSGHIRLEGFAVSGAGSSPFESINFQAPRQRLNIILTDNNDSLTAINRIDFPSGGGMPTFQTPAFIGQDFTLVVHGGVGRDSLNLRLAAVDSWAEGGAGDDFITTGLGNDTVFGGDGNDRIEDSEGLNRLNGDGGDDSIIAGIGNDVVVGGDGNDRLELGSGDDTAFGSEGSDTIDGGNGRDVLLGEDGNDSLLGQNGDDVIHAGDGSDTVDGGLGNDVVTGDRGEIQQVVISSVLVDIEVAGDQLAGGLGNDTLVGTGAADTLSGGDGDDSLNGLAGNDQLDGGTGNDSLDGNTGSDSLSAGDGNDLLFGGIDIGNDSLDGGAGTDQLFGGGGDDSLSGQDGDDVIAAGEGNDSASGGDGNDRISGDAGHDVLSGDEGRDSIDGGTGDDTLVGGEENDTLSGGSGHDVAFGLDGDDVLNGNDGNDTLTGGDDDDQLWGGAGDDALEGQEGNDRVRGQAGNDTVSGGDGVDVIDGGTGSDAVFASTHRATLTRTRLTLVNSDGDDEIKTLTSIERAIIDASLSLEAAVLNAAAMTGSVTLTGSDFADSLTGGSGADSISGGSGNDTINGGVGADTISGGDDVDSIRGGDGNDSITGDDGNDLLLGERGRDTISGGDGADSIEGDIATDSVAGTFGNDSLCGDAGNDTIRGGLGNDTLKGGADNDQLFGDRGHDLLNGGTGNDLLEGDKSTDTALAVAGNDSLTGQDGDDTLRGFAGNDVLVGGIGKDNLDGGAGNDTLLGGDDNDTITGGAGTDTAAGGAGTNTITTVETINEAFTFPGGVPAWIDEI